MATAHRYEQTELVSLRGWELDDEYLMGLPGAKPKRLLVCPNPPPAAHLIGGHRYLFKEPTGFRIHQVWSEVIAYELMRSSGMAVPPAFLAHDPFLNKPGVLVEFFYGYEGEPFQRHVNAIDYYQRHRISVNPRRGSMHDNSTICRLQGAPGWRTWWARTLAFDTLIGNTDRHTENWGFLVTWDEDGRQQFSLSPAFDNGTSLCATVRDEDVPAFREPWRMRQFVEGGRHSSGWVGGDGESAHFVALCQRFVGRFGEAGSMLEIANLPDAELDRVLEWAQTFDFPVPFRPHRAAFVREAVIARREALATALRSE